LTANASVGVVVQNATPVVAFSITPAETDEGTEILLTGTIADVGFKDEHNLEVDWGDGQITNVPLSSRSFSLPHVFEDDDPTSTVADEKRKSVR